MSGVINIFCFPGILFITLFSNIFDLECPIAPISMQHLLRCSSINVIPDKETNVSSSLCFQTKTSKKADFPEEISKLCQSAGAAAVTPL